MQPRAPFSLSLSKAKWSWVNETNCWLTPIRSGYTINDTPQHPHTVNDMTLNHTTATPSFPRRRESILGHCLRPSDLSRTNLSTVIPA